MNYQKKAIEIMDNVSKVIVGKEDVTKLVLTSLIAGGHVLLEDVPGTGKTMLAKTVAKSVDAQFSRIQFTPDLLPSDVTGINYYNQKAGEFVFRRGPVFSNILLADEINRATPRTQSALLECMEDVCLFRRYSCDKRRNHHILQCGELRQQLMKLKNETYILITECREFFFFHPAHYSSVNLHITCIRFVQRSHDLQQGSLTCPTRTYNTDNLAFVNFQINTFQDLQ